MNTSKAPARPKAAAAPAAAAAAAKSPAAPAMALATRGQKRKAKVTKEEAEDKEAAGGEEMEEEEGEAGPSCSAPVQAPVQVEKAEPYQEEVRLLSAEFPGCEPSLIQVRLDWDGEREGSPLLPMIQYLLAPMLNILARASPAALTLTVWTSHIFHPCHLPLLPSRCCLRIRKGMSLM